MFHSLGLEKHQWRSQYISESISIIEGKMRQIKKDGYTSIFMEEAHNNINTSSDYLIHLNFDDGYLDNWVHLFPILKELGLKATVYITSDFIDPRDIIRNKRSESEHDTLQANECCAGFLSFPEMKLMEESGVFEIQSHAKTHTWYFRGSKIIDYWSPGSATKIGGPVWMLWNEFPELKPYYLNNAAEIESKIPYGTPIYEHGKSLEVKKFFPNDLELKTKLIQQAKDQFFFEKDNWKELLNEIVSNVQIEGLYETDEGFTERVKGELLQSKKILEDGLGHKVNGICWPGGGIKEEVVEIAKSVGYKYFTLPSKWKKAPNSFYKEMIPRIGPLSKLTFKGVDLGAPSKSDFSLYLKVHQNNKWAKLLFLIKRFIKLLYHVVRTVFK
jgi:peptidoglycan/xylan/chitin deacetylase (PgdA/CDA1 family)